MVLVRVALAADGALRRRLGEAATRRVAPEFSMEGQAPRIAAIIGEVLAQGAGR